VALPRRTFTLSHIEYTADRLKWLFAHRELIGGLRFSEEPPVLRFFFGRLQPVDGWVGNLVDAFRAEFGEGC